MANPVDELPQSVDTPLQDGNVRLPQHIMELSSRLTRRDHQAVHSTEQRSMPELPPRVRDMLLMLNEMLDAMTGKDESPPHGATA